MPSNSCLKTIDIINIYSIDKRLVPGSAVLRIYLGYNAMQCRLKTHRYSIA
jgi:hypothetical protein